MATYGSNRGSLLFQLSGISDLAQSPLNLSYWRNMHTVQNASGILMVSAAGIFDTFLIRGTMAPVLVESHIFLYTCR